MKDISDYLSLAKDSGAFLDIELDILKEALLACADPRGSSCRQVEIRDGRLLGGFALLLRAANTDYTWDVTGFCVDPGYKDKGIPARLVALMEEDCLGASGSAILRFETSSKKLECLGADLLPSLGYSLLGHIPAFYGRKDDYYMFARHLVRPRSASSQPKAEEAPGKAPAEAADDRRVE